MMEPAAAASPAMFLNGGQSQYGDMPQHQQQHVQQQQQHVQHQQQQLQQHYYPYPHMMVAQPPPVEEEQPLMVNGKQYQRILKRRTQRAKLEQQSMLPKSRKPYLHESRHNHAKNRQRGINGRFHSKASAEAADDPAAGGGAGVVVGASAGAGVGAGVAGASPAKAHSAFAREEEEYLKAQLASLERSFARPAPQPASSHPAPGLSSHSLDPHHAHHYQHAADSLHHQHQQQQQQQQHQQQHIDRHPHYQRHYPHSSSPSQSLLPFLGHAISHPHPLSQSHTLPHSLPHPHSLQSNSQLQSLSDTDAQPDALDQNPPHVVPQHDTSQPDYAPTPSAALAAALLSPPSALTHALDDHAPPVLDETNDADQGDVEVPQPSFADPLP
eukprot:m.85417 g.85417  ORF g.85417 m.85417 type:complete len:384 (-) comp13510_c0_seq6:66-1217(-)